MVAMTRSAASNILAVGQGIGTAQAHFGARLAPSRGWLHAGGICSVPGRRTFVMAFQVRTIGCRAAV